MLSVNRGEHSETFCEKKSASYSWLDSQYVFQFIKNQEATNRLMNSFTFTMYDVYNQMYPEYFRSVMQLPPQTSDFPPWKLGMYTDWYGTSSVSPSQDVHLSSKRTSCSSGTEFLLRPNIDVTESTQIPIQTDNVYSEISEKSCYGMSTAPTSETASSYAGLSSIERTPRRLRQSDSSDAQGNGFASQGKRACEVLENPFRKIPSNCKTTLSKDLILEQHLDPHSSNIRATNRSRLAHEGCRFTASLPSTIPSLSKSCSAFLMNEPQEGRDTMTTATAFLLYVKSKVAEKQRHLKKALHVKRLNENKQRQRLPSRSAMHHRLCRSNSRESMSCKRHPEFYESYLSEQSDRSTVAAKRDLQCFHASGSPEISCTDFDEFDASVDFTLYKDSSSRRRVYKGHRCAVSQVMPKRCRPSNVSSAPCVDTRCYSILV